MLRLRSEAHVGRWEATREDEVVYVDTVYLFLLGILYVAL
jgi:hypothetical protein